MSYKVLHDCKVIPADVRATFDEGGRTTDPLVMLWRDVAARLTLDAYGITGMSKKDKSEYRELLIAIGEAQAWFLNDFDDVQLVFELARVDMQPVRIAVLHHLDKELEHVRDHPKRKRK